MDQLGGLKRASMVCVLGETDVPYFSIVPGAMSTPAWYQDFVAAGKLASMQALVDVSFLNAVKLYTF